MTASESSEVTNSADRKVEVFFDGACPLCAREVAWLRRLDAGGAIAFTDIAAPDFDAVPQTGRSHDELMARIHARLIDGTPVGTWVEGVEVFRQLYGAVGFGRLVALSRLPGVRQAFDAGYRWFARNRLRLTGRCDAEACVVPPAKPAV